MTGWLWTLVVVGLFFFPFVFAFVGALIIGRFVESIRERRAADRRLFGPPGRRF